MDILVDQIVRSLGSAGANIAESFNRSKAKFLNSLDIALGEANETENWLYKLPRAESIEPRARNSFAQRSPPFGSPLLALRPPLRPQPVNRNTAIDDKTSNHG